MGVCAFGGASRPTLLRKARIIGTPSGYVERAKLRDSPTLPEPACALQPLKPLATRYTSRDLARDESGLRTTTLSKDSRTVFTYSS